MCIGASSSCDLTNDVSASKLDSFTRKAGTSRTKHVPMSVVRGAREIGHSIGELQIASEIALRIESLPC